MTKKELAKACIKVLVSVGVGTIVTDAVAFTTPVIAMGVLKRAAIGIGSFALSAYTSDKVANYTDEKIDEVFDEVRKVVNDTEVEVEIREEAKA